MSVEKLQAGDRGVRAGDDAGLRPDRGAGVDLPYLTPDEHFVDGELAPDERLGSRRPPVAAGRASRSWTTQGRPLPQGDDRRDLRARRPRDEGLLQASRRRPRRRSSTAGCTPATSAISTREGYLHITDRKKDMIISGGFNVYPSEVEQVLWSHPAVQDCAVIGVPDEKWGEAVKAVVELKRRRSVDGRGAHRVVQARSSAASRRRRPSISSRRCRAARPARCSKKDLREPYWAGQERKI